MPSHKQTHAHTPLHNTSTHIHTFIRVAKGVGSWPQLAQCDKCVFISRIHTKTLTHKHVQSQRKKKSQRETASGRFWRWRGRRDYEGDEEKKILVISYHNRWEIFLCISHTIRRCLIIFVYFGIYISRIKPPQWNGTVL